VGQVGASVSAPRRTTSQRVAEQLLRLRTEAEEAQLEFCRRQQARTSRVYTQEQLYGRPIVRFRGSGASTSALVRTPEQQAEMAAAIREELHALETEMEGLLPRIRAAAAQSDAMAAGVLAETLAALGSRLARLRATLTEALSAYTALVQRGAAAAASDADGQMGVRLDSAGGEIPGFGKVRRLRIARARVCGTHLSANSARRSAVRHVSAPGMPFPMPSTQGPVRKREKDRAMVGLTAEEVEGKWQRYYDALDKYLLPLALNVGAPVAMAKRNLPPEVERQLVRLRAEAEAAESVRQRASQNRLGFRS
jgi:hypothetical protein